MKTLIIGRESNLTQSLLFNIPNSVALSSRELLIDITLLSRYKEETINLIFNNFQTATQLNEIKDSIAYIENAIAITAKVLEYLKETKIHKIIYTSSSSVYGNNIFCDEQDEVKPLNLAASLKVSNEKLVEGYCEMRGIDYTIARIFNMYGGDDRFSIISKIISAYENKTVLKVINNGNAIRDFIHIDDVAEVYRKLLTFKKLPILNIGRGIGSSVNAILAFLKNHSIHIDTETAFRKEIKISTANNALLKETFNKHNFTEVETYLLSRLMMHEKA